jgi:hypothetical protein
MACLVLGSPAAFFHRHSLYRPVSIPLEATGSLRVLRRAYSSITMNNAASSIEPLQFY